MSADNIILGDGVFSIGETDIALTRGGGRFTVEREYKRVEADGDMGPVKGRIRLVKSEATLTLNALELLPANLPKLYPVLDEDSETVSGTSTFTGLVADDREGIEAADYQATVKWTGKTNAGKDVVIELTNAINLGNIDWALVDKDEVIPEIVYTACYTDGSITEPWSIDIVTA